MDALSEKQELSYPGNWPPKWACLIEKVPESLQNRRLIQPKKWRDEDDC